MPLLEDIFDSLPFGMIAVNKDQHIIASNKYAQELVGVKGLDVKGLTCYALLGRTQCAETCLMNDVNANVPPPTSPEIIQVVNALGKKRTVILTAVPINDSKGLIIGCLQILKPSETAVPERLRTSPQDLSEYGLLGTSSLMHEVSYLIRSVAPTSSNVLLQGETGTGKEVVAHIIHTISSRRANPFVSLNCGALPENLIESELFGHEKGAFTGADKESKGYFETANHGTILLDEIAETSQHFQVKLLRVLESGEYQRVGSSAPKKTNARIIAATNKDLSRLVKEGLFREDLYYRLCVFPIKMPPLRERISDLPALIAYFIAEFNMKMNKNISDITEVALTILFRYSFPGNVRELKNILEYAFIRSNKLLISPADLPPHVLEQTQFFKSAPHKSVEEQNLLDILGQCKLNKAKAARTLGISRKTLYEKLKRINELPKK